MGRSLGMEILYNQNPYQYSEMITTCLMDTLNITASDFLLYPKLKSRPEQFIKFSNNVKSCGDHSVIYLCPECSHIHITPFKCTNKYCKIPACVNYRYKLSSEIVNDLFTDVCTSYKSTKSKSKKSASYITPKLKKVYEITIGSNIRTKKQLEKVIQRYICILRTKSEYKKIKIKHNYKLNYLKTFDISKRNFEKTNKLWLHFHILFIPEGIKTREFILTSRSVLKEIDPDVVFSNVGLRSKEKKFDYIAKRIAGIFGHRKEGYYYLPDLMSEIDYFSTYHNSRFVTWSFPYPLTSQRRNRTHPILCPKCETAVVFIGYINEKIRNGDDPPKNQQIMELIADYHSRNNK